MDIWKITEPGIREAEITTAEAEALCEAGIINTCPCGFYHIAPEHTWGDVEAALP